MSDNQYYRVNPEVAEAIRAGSPVVALESTIISHGMPYPQNLETARLVEKDIRENGAVPATIAILNGKYRIGLTDEELESLARDEGVIKASRRDLGTVFANHQTAATTVATTMIGAAWAGIPVFATGGTGGVHRGSELSMDVSADLRELARTPVAVVSAGVKSILDIPRTLEYLETLGVPVIGFGTQAFPAFFTRESGCEVPLSVSDTKEAAAVLAAHWHAGLTGGMLIANPIPEEASMDPSEVERFIQDALADAEKAGVTGKEVTPFLLAKIVERSGGRSLTANIALVRNNARVAAGIAVEYARAAGRKPVRGFKPHHNA